jgi:hypothetical protein
MQNRKFLSLSFSNIIWSPVYKTENLSLSFSNIIW